MIMTIRTFCASVMIVSVFLSWWVGVVCAVLLSLRYRAWEVFLFGALIDILWLPSGSFFGVPVATCASLALVWLFEPLRRQFLFDYD